MTDMTFNIAPQLRFFQIIISQHFEKLNYFDDSVEPSELVATRAQLP